MLNMTLMTWILNIILLAPLVGSVTAGIFGRFLGKISVHWVTSILIFLSFILSCGLLAQLCFFHSFSPFSVDMFHWAVVNHVNFNVGYTLDELSVFMMVIVTFVSLMVHIYSVGYMVDDPSNERFFAYISGFTFSMLALVMANNFLILFFGWEAVGLFSYLLIGFWFKKEKANTAAFRAFIANRVGDLGFILGVAGVLMAFGTLNYDAVFAATPPLVAQHVTWNLSIFGWHLDPISLICLLLFAGAAGKSAQIPLHIWLEGSMEGPTPISALIHAATMVTAGVFMLARLSPLFNESVLALSVVLVLGAATALFMGILGIVQMDIKRVVAYSTLSQLGYMMAAQGVGAYPLGMFHLMTHASFKALLFLSAGSVILGLHHEQDIRKMGGLARYMPVTYVCMLIGAFALTAIPPFSGFFSKDLIIESIQNSTIPGHDLAYIFLVLGAFVTALYTFRMFFLVFHGKSKLTKEALSQVHESSWTILLPLILLAIPSIFSGWLFFEPAMHGWFGGAIQLSAFYHPIKDLAENYATPSSFLIHSFMTLPFWLAISGVFVAWVCYVLSPNIPEKLATYFNFLYQILIRKYGIDAFYDKVFGHGSVALGRFLWKVGDDWIIDKICVQGLGLFVRLLGSFLRVIQSGYLTHYAFAMVLGLFAMLAGYQWFF
jgi:NADH-quinone oxidoreductase subunit L